jgi:hypothetical protein
VPSPPAPPPPPAAAGMLGQVFSYGNFVDGVAGMSGGVVAISVFYPLNKIRMELQVRAA